MSPRAFDSDDAAHAQHSALRFTENVDCPRCDAVFEGEFFDESMNVQDIAEPPSATHTCPVCQHRWVSCLTGWTMYGEAG